MKLIGLRQSIFLSMLLAVAVIVPSAEAASNNSSSSKTNDLVSSADVKKVERRISKLELSLAELKAQRLSDADRIKALEQDLSEIQISVNQLTLN